MPPDLTAKPVEISAEVAKQEHGITTLHERMPSGEMRFRLKTAEGAGYILTIAGPEGGWQRSHYHLAAIETYAIQSGWMILASRVDGKLLLRLLKPGNLISTIPNLAHTAYIPANAVIHTIKYGPVVPNDWYAAPELDELTHQLSEEEALRIARE